ncbi:MAG: HEAT repeat domain-containing protein [Anaerolineales bacterium]|nr:HEAT repeat domain-containing protein [Anaerolineales bacterium]
MDQEKIKPFPAVLNDLFEGDTIPISELYRLSDLTAEQLAQFTQRWGGVPDERRRQIVRHLADIAEENTVVNFSPVFTHCFTDPLPAVRIAALDGVWDESSVRMIPEIVHLLHDPVVEVQAAAAAALSHYVLTAEWGQVPKKAVAPAVAALLALYDRPETAVPVKRAALEALGAASHPRLPGLIEEAYASDDFDMMLSAVFAMGSSADERWLPTLLDEMHSDHVEMRIEAARAAGAIGDEAALPTLAHLAMDEDLEVGLAVVEALQQIGGDTAYRMLTQMAEDDYFERLHDAIDDALEEIDWLGGEFDWTHVGLDDDEDDDLLIDADDIEARD